MTDAAAYPQSRNNAFGQGTGAVSTAPISSIHQQPQADPMFHPTSVLDMYENIPSGIGQDPRETGAARTKQYGITARPPAPSGGQSPPPAASGSNQGSSVMNV
jgi:hypothetical protein